MKKSLIIALDFSNRTAVHDFLNRFGSEKLFVKVGMELFYQVGPTIIADLKEKGHDVFLDLKLHDIPATVQQAMKGLAKLDVDLVNVHAAGGSRMMEAAVEGLNAGTKSGNSRPKCIAVTQLTSTTEAQMNQEQNIKGSLDASVLNYALLAKKSGLDGVVCSTFEAETIHLEISKDFITVTPGIRMPGGERHDQNRVATPYQARMLGVDAIVVGRSITQAADPMEAYKKILESWEGEGE